MNHCAIQQNAFSTREEIRSSVSVPVSDRRDPVVCPKPRRLGLLNNHPARSIRFQLSHQSELCDSRAGNEFLDIILTKVIVFSLSIYSAYFMIINFFILNMRLKNSGPGPITTAKISTVKEFIADVFGPSINLAASSPPPFFCGSPPSRVANPLIQDARFGDEKFSPLSPVTPVPPTMGLSSSSSLSPRKGGLVRANFGNKPGVRIEGFDCLDRDRRNCSIPALA